MPFYFLSKKLCILLRSLFVPSNLKILPFLYQQVMKQLRVWIFECRDPSEKAFKLGLAAAKLLVLAHVIANMLGACNCICSQEELRRASLSRKLSVALLIFTWYVVLIMPGLDYDYILNSSTHLGLIFVFVFVFL